MKLLNVKHTGMCTNVDRSKQNANSDIILSLFQINRALEIKKDNV